MKKEQKTFLSLFIVASIILALVHYYNIGALRRLDIPTHFIGGMMIAVFLPWSLLIKKPLLVLSLLLAIGIGWELLEITVSNLSTNDFIIRASEESAGNKIQDVLVGFGGLSIVYWKQKSGGKKS